MITCRVCNINKPEEEYHFDKACVKGRVKTCRLCVQQRKKDWYAANRERRQMLTNKRNQERKLEWIRRKGGVCMDCKGAFPPCAFDFHHVGGKDANPSAVMTWAVERAEKEMSKCILLCANCHRIRHFDNPVQEVK